MGRQSWKQHLSSFTSFDPKEGRRNSTYWLCLVWVIGEPKICHNMSALLNICVRRSGSCFLSQNLISLIQKSIAIEQQHELIGNNFVLRPCRKKNIYILKFITITPSQNLITSHKLQNFFDKFKKLFTNLKKICTCPSKQIVTRTLS